MSVLALFLGGLGLHTASFVVSLVGFSLTTFGKSILTYRGNKNNTVIEMNTNIFGTQIATTAHEPPADIVARVASRAG